MTERPPLRVAMTETASVYTPMPQRTADLMQLAGQLDELRAANVAHHIELIAAAADSGAQLIGLGELFAAPYFALGEIPSDVQELWRGLAEDARSGPTVTELSAAARQHRVTLVAPIYELCPKTHERFNTAAVIDETGRVLGTYRKNHIPEGTNEQGHFQERLFYGPSDGAMQNDAAFNISKSPHFPVFQTTHARIGVAICYDRHFEGVMRTLAENGAELVLSPAVTFGAHSRRMWELEFQVDAARHNLFIGGSNRRGCEPPWNQEFFGASYFTGPSGRVDPLASPPGLVIADLDLDSLRAGSGSGWDLRRDRRPELFER